MIQVIAPVLVDVEDIQDMTFQNEMVSEVNSEIQRKISDVLLMRNAYHKLVLIIFESDSGIKKVKTTLWAGGSNSICMEGGIWLPVKRIIEINLI